MKSLPSKCADAVIIDPPYGVYLGTKGRNQKSLDSIPYSQYEDTPANLIKLIDAVMPEFYRLARRIIITPGVRNMWKWPQPDHVGAFYYPSATGCNAWGFSCWQPIFYYGKDPYLAEGLGSRPDSTQSTEKAERNGHPCPKPIGQWEWLVARTTLESETILDSFMGSGTTGIAALRLGRQFIGIEKDPDYFAIARDRLEREQANIESTLFYQTEQRKPRLVQPTLFGQ
jgi:DNA modification methylase